MKQCPSLQRILVVILLACVGTVYCMSGFPISKSKFRSIKYKKNITLDDNRTSIIWSILANTTERYSHQMRGETNNVLYTKLNGNMSYEAVYDSVSEQLVKNDYNQGSLNYYDLSVNPVLHFSFDVLPWLQFGNTRNDPTSYHERLWAYSKDLSIGIQSYIFKREIPQTIKFSDLSKAEADVVLFFNGLLFDENYEIKMDEENLDKLKADAEFYFAYFDQILLKLGVKAP